MNLMYAMHICTLKTILKTLTSVVTNFFYLEIPDILQDAHHFQENYCSLVSRNLRTADLTDAAAVVE